MKEIEVKVYKETSNELPEYETSGSACMDIRASDICSVPSGETSLVHTGLYVEIPIGFEIQVRPRSGLAIKKGITVLNSPGTIDSDYRGEICVILHNTSKELFLVDVGDRIAQLVIKEVTRIKWRPVSTHGALKDTIRGEGGFGSTGKR